MADMTVVAPPVHTDEEIVPRIRWVPIGKSNCSLDLDKKQSNPVFKMAVDLLMHTNFHKAFTASSTIPKDTLREALQITPINNNQAFISHPSAEVLVDFVNELGYPKLVRNVSNIVTNDMFQPWRELTTITNLCLTGKTSVYKRPRAPVLQILWGIVTQSNIDYAERIWEEFTQSIHTFIEDKRNLSRHTTGKVDSPLHLPDDEPVLGYLKFSAKGFRNPNAGSVTSFGTVISFIDAFSSSSSDKTCNLILRLKTRRIFRNLESFVGGRLREGDYRLLKRGANGVMENCGNTKDRPCNYCIRVIKMERLKKEKSKNNGRVPTEMELELNNGRVPTEMELELEHTQQGSSYEVSPRWENDPEKLGTAPDLIERLVSDQSSNPTSSTNPNPKGRNRRRSKQRIVNSNLEKHSHPVLTMADQRTMAQLLQAPTENKQFYGHDKEDPHAHSRYFNKTTSTLKFPNVPNTSIKLMLFPFSLEVSMNASTSGVSPDVAKLKDMVKALLLAVVLILTVIIQPPMATFTVTIFKNLYLKPSQLTTTKEIPAINRFIPNHNRGNNFNQGPVYQPPVFQQQAYQAPAYQAPAPQTQGVSKEDFLAYVKANDAVMKNIASTSSSGTLSSNTIANPKSDLKAITTRSGVSYDEPQIPPLVVENEPEATKDIINPTNNGNTEDVQPQEVQSESPVSTEPAIAPIFKDMSFKISFADALILMPKFASTLKDLIVNKQKLSEMARTPLNEHCSTVLLKKLPKKLRDPGKFLIPCDFSGMVECLTLADLGASINLMPFSMWKRLSLPDLTPTCMTLELANRLISRLFGVAEDVYVKVGSFHVLADVVVVDFDADPRVPLILRRSFLKTGRALIDVFKCELTLRVGKEAITFNLDQTSRYFANYSDMTAKCIDVIDMACEEYSQEVLGFYDTISSGSPTPYHDSIVSATSPTLTPFENSDFLLKELMNPVVELKALPPHLEYAFLECDDKLPVIIAKYLSLEEKNALITVLKSHNQAIAWKLYDIKGINPEFCTHKIFMEEDFAPAVQHQRRVNLKIHDVIKQEVIKLLDTGLIYPISDSPWVSPVHCVPKKRGFIVVENEDNELIPTRLVTGWRVCIDYHKLNEAT
nr:reverse transcriptase domain-containing protein [Tanacetum cinerariifolium]